MKKHFKILCMGLALALSSTSVFAASTENHSIVTTDENQRAIVFENEYIIVFEDRDIISEDEDTLISPYLSYDKAVSLSPDKFDDLKSDDNWKDVDVTVVNHTNNTGSIMMKFYDKNGKDIHKDTISLAPGKDRVYRIKKDVGRYTIAAKSSVKGTYQINMYDKVVK